MKIIQFIFIISITINSSYAQLHLGGSYNIDIYKPYTPETQEYLKTNDQVSSKTYHLYLTCKIVEKGKFSWYTGLGYKQIQQLVKGRVKAYNDYDPNTGQYYYKENILDLRNRSLSLAWKNDLVFTFLDKTNIKNELGLSNEFYFLERWRSTYLFASTGEKFENNNIYILPLNSGFFNLYASSANLSLFYRFTWQAKEKLSLGTKISLGTNLYSDWDQFRKYAWLGVGLELGFGKRKE